MVATTASGTCRRFRIVRKTSNEVARPGAALIDMHRGAQNPEGC
jgi:hypothetical protein